MLSIRWGILGCGRIAGTFAEALAITPGAELVAVGSRSLAKAEEFGAKHGAMSRYGSYAELANDPEVDIIYIATPHPMHVEDTILCLNSGKAILTEKPFTINAKQAQLIFEAAKRANRFAMEAHWSRFIPMMGEVRKRIADGEIGDVRMLSADFGFRTNFDPANRLFDPNLGGGALLDVGCYCVSLAVMLLGDATAISGTAQIGSTGVDEQAAMSLQFDGGRLALLSTAVRTNTQQEAIICGTEGRIHLHTPWWKLSSMTIYRNGKEPEFISEPVEGSGFRFEIEEAMECLKESKIESNIMPHSQTVEIMRIMDELRFQWGLEYPGEKL